MNWKYKIIVEQLNAHQFSILYDWMHSTFRLQSTRDIEARTIYHRRKLTNFEHGKIEGFCNCLLFTMYGIDQRGQNDE